MKWATIIISGVLAVQQLWPKHPKPIAIEIVPGYTVLGCQAGYYIDQTHKAPRCSRDQKAK